MRNTSDLPGSGTLSEEIMRKRHLKRRHRRGVRILRTLLLLILAGMIAVLATGPSGDIRSIKRLFATVTDRTGTTKPGTTSSDANSPTTSTRSTATTTTHPASTAPDAVGVRQFTFVDHSRLIYPPHTATGQPEPRTLVTYLYYPAISPAAKGAPSSPSPAGSGTAQADGPTAGQSSGENRDTAQYGPSQINNYPRAYGNRPLPLIVFAHGYEVWPWRYQPLLYSWVNAGFVVAAPVFPLTNPDAPGGPYEDDIVNQPQDVNFVLSQLLGLNAQSSGPIAGLIDPSEIGVAGHSDGAETMMAVGYDTCCINHQVKAAAILSGAKLYIDGGNYFPGDTPPLLVVQGTADTINLPIHSQNIYEEAPPPKYFLQLAGAGHYAPYVHSDPFEQVVAEVTTDFFLKELVGNAQPFQGLSSPGALPSFADLQQTP
ncbi:MAG: alpha/beta hydrolase [Actinobacteria bacterium]|nr:alpha/beta hydrolase [Actinomycetota bacterium]